MGGRGEAGRILTFGGRPAFFRANTILGARTRFFLFIFVFYLSETSVLRISPSVLVHSASSKSCAGLNGLS